MLYRANKDAICRNCQYWAGERDGTGIEQGNCVRFPPVLVSMPQGIGTAWPQLPAEAICGEWKPDEATHKRMLQRAAFAGTQIVGVGQ